MLRRLSAIIRTKWIIKLLPFAFAIIVLAILLPTINATVQKAKTYHVLLASLPEHLEKTIDPDCYIIVEEPMILSSSTKLKIVSLPDFLDNTDDMIDHLSQTKCVLFFETPYCNRGNCEKIRKNYKLGTVSGFKRGVEKWTLYNISFSGSVV